MNQAVKQLLTFAFALVFLTGAAFAQSNDASINNALGDNNEALIEQAGTMNDGSIYLGQSNRNDVTIDQAGTSNQARFEFRGDRNEVMGVQDGTENQMFVNFRGTGPGPQGAGASRSDFYFEQAGEGNMISGGIVGDQNEGDVRQSGVDNELLGGGGLYSAEGIMIDGDDNYLRVRQLGTANQGLVDVAGNDNQLRLSQDGSGHYGEILINGSGNDHEIIQSN
jgi:hypothetical protein